MREQVQTEEAAQGIRQLARDLQALQPLGQGWIIERLFRELHASGVIETARPVLLLDSMSVPVHPDACGVLKKRVGSR